MEEDETLSPSLRSGPVSPKVSLQLLRDGNARFATGRSRNTATNLGGWDGHREGDVGFLWVWAKGRRWFLYVFFLQARVGSVDVLRNAPGSTHLYLDNTFVLNVWRSMSTVWVPLGKTVLGSWMDPLRNVTVNVDHRCKPHDFSINHQPVY